VMVHVDMGFLPYLGMPDGYHFGGHVIVVAGRDGDTFVVADRDGVLHPVVGDDLRAARASKHKPFPPAHTRYRIQVERARTPTEADVRAAVAANAEAMLHGPITNLGVRGIRKAARLVPGWAGMLEPAELRGTCINNWIFIDATGGTGGGMFRLMYGRFLAEAGLLLGAGPLTEQADAAESLGRAWDEVGAVFQAVGTEAAPPTALTGLKESLVAIADGEEQLWTALATWAGGEGETTSP